MSLNLTPGANRLHIAFFGRRNAGKSSLVNAVTGQNLAIVSEIKGTTTDPVYKSMELLPLGPVVIIDTPGFDDEGDLGEKRIEKTLAVLRKTDIAVLVLDGEKKDDDLLNLIKERKIPYLIVLNKIDEDLTRRHKGAEDTEVLPVSAKTGYNIFNLKEKIASLAPREPDKHLVADLIKPNDFIVLVIPIDKAAPKGRLILPQQQMIRDILEAGAVAIAVRETELQNTLENLGKPPALVITDSQVFAEVSSIVPREIPLTSFSILFARYKGFLETAVQSTAALNSLKDGDKILICEGCTHHRQCDDIGTVKIPKMIKKFCGKEIDFNFCSGGEFPSDLSTYNIVIHCGGCMLNEREMQYRHKIAKEQNAAFTNYGVAIAFINGILERCLEVFSRGDHGETEDTE